MIAEFLYNPPSHGNNAHCGTLLELKDGSLLAAWYSYPGNHDYEDARLVVARRRAGDGQWQPSTSLLEKFSSSAGNPLLFQEGGSETLTLFFVLLKGNYWNHSVLHSCSSLDSGFSWSVPSVVWKDKGMMVRHPPLVLEDSSMLLPAYDEKSNRSLLLRGKGDSWHVDKVFEDIPLIQPVLIEDSSGRLTAFFRPADEPRRVWRAHSTDKGKRWSNPIQTLLPCPLSGVAAFSTPHCLCVVYNHSLERRVPLSLAASYDGGISWSEPWNLDETAQEVSYPSFIVGSDGMIHGVYTFNRRMLKYISFSEEELYERTGKDRAV
ncbi:MAG: exo-alpha-sialidase [Bdellovibrionales bacterium]|nr:exo-alpha-sialidase [Bdellovibrionales bacterium]